MKIKGLLFVLVVLVMAGCKNDINVLTKYKEVPVVYGLLSITDSVHYIRIQKGYQAKGNAYLAGGILDSIYYPDVLKVTLKALPNGPTYTYQRVVINYNPADPLSKDSGTFAYGINILYADTHSLNPNLTYRLQIVDTTSHDTIITQTTLVEPFQINTPFFLLGQPPFGTKMSLSNTNPEKIDWQPAVNGSIYDVQVRFNYKETNTLTNFTKDSFVDFTMASSYVPSASSSSDVFVLFYSNILFSTLAHQLTPSNNIYRDFDSKRGMIFTFSAGGTALSNYLSAAQAQSGLTSDQALPPYTNIPGGVGIFSSRLVEVVDSVQLSDDARDSLSCSSITQSLRFRNHNGVFCQ